MRSLSILFLAFLASACATPRPPAPDANTRNAGIAQKKLMATYRSITRSAADIAGGRIPSTKLSEALTNMCHQQCEATFFRCVAGTVPGIPIPEMSQRAPKEFPYEIPECTDPDCSSSSVSEPDGSGCVRAREACDKRCDCAVL